MNMATWNYWRNGSDSIVLRVRLGDWLVAAVKLSDCIL